MPSKKPVKKNKPTAVKKIVKKEPEKNVSKKKETITPVKTAAVRNVKALETLRGMKDILPKEEKYWLGLRRNAEKMCAAYGYGYFDTPILENAGLFIRSIGKGTDVIEKEMYVFEDRDGDKVALRPELTASAVRAYINNGMHTYSQPVKLWYFGPMFRHDRPQAGRFRQFNQFGCEVFGAHDPVVDAELIVLAHNFIADLGIKSTVHINSIGTLSERKNYISELVSFLKSRRSILCEDCKRRLLKNPLRCLDCKEESCKKNLEEAPQIVDWLEESSKNFFMKVLEYLDELSIPYVLNPRLVRGLDYYCDTVFEFFAEEEGEGGGVALGGGGRYDGLVEQMGGQPTAGCGFALGVERIIAVWKKMENKEPEVAAVGPAIYFAQLGEQARKKALYLLEDLRKAGIFVFHNLSKGSLKVQLESANSKKVTHTVILGQKEVQDGTVIIRDMESGIQEIIDQKKLRAKLEKILGKNQV